LKGKVRSNRRKKKFKKMEVKNQDQKWMNPNYGFGQAPPTYDQSFNQPQPSNFIPQQNFSPQQQPIYTQPPYSAAGAQVITGKN
jgi:hypothetical protein